MGSRRPSSQAQERIEIVLSREIERTGQEIFSIAYNTSSHCAYYVYIWFCILSFFKRLYTVLEASVHTASTSLFFSQAFFSCSYLDPKAFFSYIQQNTIQRLIYSNMHTIIQIVYLIVYMRCSRQLPTARIVQALICAKLSN